jgi:acetyltransferase
MAEWPDSCSGAQAFLHPRSVVVVGASPNLDSVSGRPLKYLRDHGFQGDIYLVNPKYTEVAGLPCYPSVRAIPRPADLAIIGVAARHCLGIVEDCVAAKVRAAVIFAGGFAETGAAGAELQEKLAALARGGGVRLCGPNCLGITSLPARLAATFSPALDEKSYFRGGSAVLVTQSGAVGFGLYTMCQDAGLGLRYVVSVGNEIDLTSTEVIDWVLDDPEVRVVLCYLETIRDQEYFARVAEKARSLRKPIVVIKVGKSKIGAAAALVHTASAVGNDADYASLFQKTGVVRATDLDHLIDLGLVFDRLARSQNDLPAAGNAVIVATSGGAGILMADKWEESGFPLARLDAETRAALAQIVPAFGSTLNPVDVTGQVVNEPTLVQKCLETVAQAAEVNLIFLMLGALSPEIAERVIAGVVEASRSIRLPVVGLWTGGKLLTRHGEEILAEHGIPCYNVPGRAARAVTEVIRYARLVGAGK